ncbi:MAG: acetylaminoadipate kinase, partial [Nitrososphaerota archaeon]|nr:acetylaminoadipate kinase [Nitrososphaerota archaeon]
YLPVISPVAMGFEGEALNIDGDRTAAAIAAALKADRLVIFTDVEGLLMDGKLVEHMDRGEAKETLRKVGPGMDKKVMACIEALEGGVRESVISSGLVQHPLENALEGQHRTVIV